MLWTTLPTLSRLRRFGQCLSCKFIGAQRGANALEGVSQTERGRPVLKAHSGVNCTGLLSLVNKCFVPKETAE